MTTNFLTGIRGAVAGVSFPSLITSLALVVLLTGCHDDHDHDHEGEERNEAAIAIHNQLVEVEASVLAMFEEWNTAAQENGLEQAMVDSLNAFQIVYDNWAEYVVEPAGAHEGDDDHGHDHDHDHSHEPAPDLTPEQMVEVQRALLDEITSLKSRMESLGQDASSN